MLVTVTPRLSRTLVVAVALAAAAFQLARASDAAAGASPPVSHAVVIARRESNCVLHTVNGNTAQPKAGAGESIDSQLAVLRRPQTTSDVPPQSAQLDAAISAAGALSYDPAGVRRLAMVKGGAVYVVPAVVGAPKLASSCASVSRSAYVTSYLADEAATVGAGDGVCLLDTAPQADPALSARASSSTGLPPPPYLGPTAQCGSTALFDGYVGALGSGTVMGGVALVRDGVTQVTYTFDPAGGERTTTVPVSGNLVRAPVLSFSYKGSLAHITGLYDELYPTSITEAAGPPTGTATLPRPASLISAMARQTKAFNDVSNTLNQACPAAPKKRGNGAFCGSFFG